MRYVRAALIVAACLMTTNAFGNFHAYVQAAYGSAPYSITTYDPLTGKLGDFSFATGGQAVQVMGSPDGSQIWIIGLTSNLSQGFVAIYDTSSQTIVANLDLPGTSYGCYDSCPVGLFSPNGKLFYAITDGSAGTNLLVYSVPAKKLLKQTVVTGVGAVVSIAISPDGSRIFLNDRSQIAAINPSTGEMLETLPISVSFMVSAGNTLLVPGSNELIYIDMATDTETATLSTMASPAAITVSADGSKAVLKEVFTDNTGANSYDIQTVNVPARSIAASGTLPGDVGVILSPDGTELTVLGVNSKPEAASIGFWAIETWDPESYTVSQRTRLFSNGVVPLYAASTLYLYFYSSLVSVVDGASKTVTQQVPVGGGGAELVSVPGEEFVYAFTNGGLDLVRPGISRPVPSLAIYYGIGATFSALGVSQSQIYAVGGESNSVSAIDFVTGEFHALRTPGFVQPQGCFNTLGMPLVSPNQKAMILDIGVLCGPPPDAPVDRWAPSQTSPTSGLAIYTTSSDTLSAQVAVNSSGPVVISPDSTPAYVTTSDYSGQGEGHISVVDLATATVANTWNYPNDPVFAGLAISPDGKTLYGSALVGNAGVLLFIETLTGSVTRQVPLSATAASIALSPDGSELVIAEFQGTEQNSLGIMDLRSGSIIYVDTGYLPAGQVVVTN